MARPSVLMSILFGSVSRLEALPEHAQDFVGDVAALGGLLLDADENLVLLRLLVALDADLAEARPVQERAHLVDVGALGRSG